MLLLDDGQYQIHGLVLSPERSNCYIVKTPEATVIIDPGDDADAVVAYCTGHSLMPATILATHGHADHIGAAHDLISRGIANSLYIYEGEDLWKRHARVYARLMHNVTLEIPNTLGFDCWPLSTLIVRHTPGHTPGSCVVYDIRRKFVFTGDTILNNMLGPTVAPRDADDLRKSLWWMRNHFVDDAIVFPGHGKPSLFGVEWDYNQQIRQLIYNEPEAA